LAAPIITTPIPEGRHWAVLTLAAAWPPPLLFVPSAYLPGGLAHCPHQQNYWPFATPRRPICPPWLINGLQMGIQGWVISPMGRAAF
jgi:hypothetical protein